MPLRDYYNAGDGTQSAIYGTQYVAQVFTASVDYDISSVKLKLYKGGSPTFNLVVAIRAVVSNKPSGGNIVSGTIDASTLGSSPGAFVEATFGSAHSLTNGTKYAIVVYAEGDAGSYPAAYVMWRADATSPTYTGGHLCTSVNSGGTWTINTAVDNMFETYSINGNGNGNGGVSLGNSVLNTFVGKLFGYDLRYREEWFTDSVDYDTGKEQRNQIWQRPKRHWVLPYNVLLQAYRDKLIELCSRAKGMYNIFLFENPYDYECALTECSITAIVAQVEFQLIKTYYGGESETWDENKTRIQPSSIFPPVIEVDDVTKIEGTDYTLDDDTGIVDFTLMGAPGADKVITANYRFYCPVRFDRDVYEETTIYSGIWNMGDIPIVEVIE